MRMAVAIMLESHIHATQLTGLGVGNCRFAARRGAKRKALRENCELYIEVERDFEGRLEIPILCV